MLLPSIVGILCHSHSDLFVIFFMSDVWKMRGAYLNNSSPHEAIKKKKKKKYGPSMQLGKMF